MLTRSRNLLILAGLSLGASVAAVQVPALARHYDSHVRTSGHDGCPYHHAQAAAKAVRTAAATGRESSPLPPEGSIFSLGRSAVFTP